MDMNTNSVYQNIKWFITLQYHTLKNRIPEKCSMCLKYHTDDKDEFVCYGEYLEKHPKNTDVEVWDIEKKIWVKKV